jgi:hypothetical protein
MKNEAGDELNRTEQVTCGTHCHQLCIPSRSRVLKDKIEGVSLLLDPLDMSIPLQHKHTSARSSLKLGHIQG